MEKKCKLVLLDEVNASFEGLDPKTRRACYDELKYFIHAARHTPAFKLGRWDGCVSYFAVNGNTYINLLDRVLPIIAKAGWEIEVDDKRPEREVFEFPEIDTEYLVDHLGGPVWPEKHPAAGQQIKLRDHQVDAIRKFIENPQALGEIATGAGKTVITAVLSSLVQPYGRSIVIVPNKDLVKQTESDYKLVGLDTGVYFGDRKELGHIHTICTWQSLDRLIKAPAANKDTLDSIKKDLVAVIVDECLSGNTKIRTPLGEKCIKDMMPGDKVISYNESTGLFVEDEVVKVHKNLMKSESAKFLRITLEDDSFIEITENHKVLTKKGWVEAGLLTTDDDILDFGKTGVKHKKDSEGNKSF